jgi:uncharacterized protein
VPVTPKTAGRGKHAGTVLLRLLALVALVAGWGLAQAKRQPGMPTWLPAVNSQVPGQPLLWRATAPNGNIGYIFGTIHVGVHLADLPAVVRSTVAASSRVVVETDVAGPDLQELAKEALLPPGVTLDQLVGSEAWRNVVALVPQIPEESLRRLQPWVVLSVVYFGSNPTSAGGASDTFLDSEIATLAEALGTTVAFLETPDEQCALIREALTVDDLVELAENPSLAKVQATVGSDFMTDLYLRGDAEALASAMLSSSSPSEARLIKKMLMDRTERWAPDVDRMIREQAGVLIAVGAGHVVGPEGLVSLLERRGYRVERVASR